MRLYVNLPTPLATAIVAAAERERRRPGDELMVLAEAELRRRGLLDQVDRVSPVVTAGGEVGLPR
jgi:hypothetical protein